MVQQASPALAQSGGDRQKQWYTFLIHNIITQYIYICASIAVSSRASRFPSLAFPFPSAINPTAPIPVSGRYYTRTASDRYSSHQFYLPCSVLPGATTSTSAATSRTRTVPQLGSTTWTGFTPVRPKQETGPSTPWSPPQGKDKGDPGSGRPP